jgi:hypothetical protein
MKYPLQKFLILQRVFTIINSDSLNHIVFFIFMIVEMGERSGFRGILDFPRISSFKNPKRDFCSGHPGFQPDLSQHFVLSQADTTKIGFLNKWSSGLISITETV